MKRKHIEKNVQPDTRNGPPARGMPEKWLYVTCCIKQLVCGSHPKRSRRVDLSVRVIRAEAKAVTEVKALAETKVKLRCLSSGYNLLNNCIGKRRVMHIMQHLRQNRIKQNCYTGPPGRNGPGLISKIGLRQMGNRQADALILSG